VTAVTLRIWNESTREELRQALPGSVVVLPTGATEQHGPHLPTGHDSFTVTDIAARAAETAATPVVLAPTLTFGSSHHHLPFGGTLSLSTDTYYRVVRELVESMIAAGARRIFLLNGHGGNQELNVLVARDVPLAQPVVEPVVVAAASYWQLAQAALDAEPALAGVPSPGHAGQFETATMLATAPDRVREPRAERTHDPYVPSVVPGARVEQTGMWAMFDGYTDFPHRATADLGGIILDHVIRDVAIALDTLAGVRLE
jgi:creatinine amidohydrolase